MMAVTKQQLYIAQGCVIEDNKVLFIRRHEPKLPQLHGLWELPGGKIKFGEDPSKAAEREILEETGAEVVAGDMVPFPYYAVRKSKTSLLNPIILCYRCNLQEQGNEFKVPKKIWEVKWMHLNTIDPIKIQSGTLQFLQYFLNIEGLKSKGIPAEFSSAYICLRSYDGKKNRNRSYDIVIESTLNTESTFKVQLFWGRMYNHRNVQLKEFQERDKMLKFIERVLITRSNHDYEILKQSQNFPYFSVLKQMKNVRDDKNQQLNLF